MTNDEKFVLINNSIEELKIYIQHYLDKHTENWSEVKDIWTTLRRISNILDVLNLKADE